MRYAKHAKQGKFTLILFLILGIFLGAILGFFLSPKIISTDKGEKIKTADREIEFITHHTVCGHDSSHTEPDIKQFSSIDSIKNAFPEWTLKNVTDSKIILEKNSATYCPLHYFAYLKENKIHIETISGDKIKTIDVSSYVFTNEEQTKLEEGIYLNGFDSYISFIEDFSV